jgi:NADPH-dependent 2,4-dienoyl-CoA reductase/sulfur reductase-like enzyme/nitrite reductase/ring-hydroxylating ferredoxin subunit
MELVPWFRFGSGSRVSVPGDVPSPMSSSDSDAKLDLSAGVDVSGLADGAAIAGTVDGEDAILVRDGSDLYAVGAHCTHYHGPLADGLVSGGTVRCPWHHACFSLKTGEALRAPALDPIACWQVERRGDVAFVRAKREPSRASVPAVRPSSVVIVGGGAAGLAAADMLRREGYDGPVTIVSADEAPPADRPNLSKDYLAGTAKEDWIPLRGPEYYDEQRIELMLGATVTGIDAAAKVVTIEGRAPRPYGALLLATGADPVHLSIPGAGPDDVLYLRSFGDSRAIIQRAEGAGRCVVIGASFIGLEVAASLRARGLAVDVVAPEAQPLERVLGPDVGHYIRRLHESHGVTFHLGQTVARLDGRAVTLSGGASLDADLVVAGVGVRPSIALAERTGLAVDRGIAVNAYLETSAPGIYAAGDAARWPDPHTGTAIRVEHWVVAQRQGQAAARNILGRREPFDAVPFFWSQHYDVAINYVGHAERWDEARLDGSLEQNDCTITYALDGRTLAVATIYRDRESLEAERRMETEPAS